MTIEKSKTILVIEDDEDISFALSTWLENENYNVSVAENGAVALELLSKHGIPDLILLDTMMPVMNGWEFTKMLAAKYDSFCPIIIMSAAEDAKQRASDIGAIGWIGKPFLLKDLMKLIKEHVKN